MMAGSCAMLRSLRDVSDHPDVADDTFLLAGRALSYAPRLLLTPQLLSVLLDTALAGLLVQHREACCSILAFVVRLLDPATHRAVAPEAVQGLQAALAPRAPLLVRLLGGLCMGGEVDVEGSLGLVPMSGVACRQPLKRLHPRHAQLLPSHPAHHPPPPLPACSQVRLVLAGAVGALPTNRLAELTDVLYAVLKVGLPLVGC